MGGGYGWFSSFVSNIVRLLDKGKLSDQYDYNLEFIVVELGEIPVKTYVYEVAPKLCHKNTFLNFRCPVPSAKFAFAMWPCNC